MEEIKLSVIIPIYNVEKYLRQCVDSVIGQSYRTLEIILVDDGSTDSCAAICDAYAAKDARVKVIHKENGGVSSAREAGLRLVSGDYVMYLDSDDWLDSETVLGCMEQIEKEPDTDCVMFSYCKECQNETIAMHVFDRTQWFRDEAVRETVYRRLFGQKGTELAHPERMENLSSCCMKMYRSSYAKQGKFTDLDEIGSCEDGLYNMYALYGMKTACYLDLPMYHYRKTEGTATSTYRPRLTEQWGRLFSIMEAVIREKGLSEQYTEALYNRIALSITAIGLNEISQGFLPCCRKVRQYLRSERYRAAVKKLEMKHLPITWKLFMTCAKLKCAVLLCVGIKLINILKGR